MPPSRQAIFYNGRHGIGTGRIVAVLSLGTINRYRWVNIFHLWYVCGVVVAYAECFFVLYFAPLLFCALWTNQFWGSINRSIYWHLPSGTWCCMSTFSGSGRWWAPNNPGILKGFCVQIRYVLRLRLANTKRKQYTFWRTMTAKESSIIWRVESKT